MYKYSLKNELLDDSCGIETGLGFEKKKLNASLSARMNTVL